MKSAIAVTGLPDLMRTLSFMINPLIKNDQGVDTLSQCRERRPVVIKTVDTLGVDL